MDPVGWGEWEGRKERDLERKLGEGMELLQFPRTSLGTRTD